MVRQYKKYSEEQVGIAIKDSFSWRETAFKLGLNGNAGSNNQTLRKIAKKYNFNFSHFKGQGWNLGKNSINAIPLEDVLKKGSRIRSDNLKKILFKKGILEEQCSECGQLPIWNGKPLTLELDHIDGDISNNELSNLRILCLHCHSQTKSFRGRKLKRERKKQNKKIYDCESCGIKICKNKNNLCKKCFIEKNLHRKVKDRPSKEQLLKEIEETNLSIIGKKYGVSATCIKKWLK